MIGAASSPNLVVQQGCLQGCSSFHSAVIAPPPLLFISLDVGSVIWVRPLGPIAPQGAAWMHFPCVAKGLRYLCSKEGEPTEVRRVGKANAMRDGYALTFHKPSSLVLASPTRS